jgi:hypothetical protein
MDANHRNLIRVRKNCRCDTQLENEFGRELETSHRPPRATLRSIQIISHLRRHSVRTSS